MPKICYIARSFPSAVEALIVAADAIVEAYAAEGYQLTLRQLYYKLVTQNLIPNTDQSYARLGAIINAARLAGRIDWAQIVDRTRHLEQSSHWKGPGDLLTAAIEQFAIDKWADQAHRCEVWIEKDALVGMIEATCRALDVPYFACRGYVSQTEMWIAAGRLARWVDAGYEPVIFHLGDHDPSGLDMTRDIRERLALFLGTDIELTRLALNRDQIDEFQLPPNPTKVKDSRSREYIKAHGNQSWELDALDYKVLQGLIKAAVRGVRNERRWRAARGREQAMRAQLQGLADGTTIAWID